MVRPPPGPTRTSTPFPYTTLFRSLQPAHADAQLHPPAGEAVEGGHLLREGHRVALREDQDAGAEADRRRRRGDVGEPDQRIRDVEVLAAGHAAVVAVGRSEEHTSELQSLMRISYADFCLKKK